MRFDGAGATGRGDPETMAPAPARAVRRWQIAVGASLALSALPLNGGPPDAAAAGSTPPNRDRLATCPVGPRPALSIAPAAGRRIVLGRFVVALSAGRRGGLAVTERTDGRVLWSSTPGRPFVGAARGSQDWQGKSGFLVGTTALTDCWRRQHVVSTRFSRRRLTIAGTLSGGRGDAVTYRVIVARAAADRLRLRVRLSGGAANIVTLTAASSPGEAFHGFGAMTRWNLKGSLLPVITREQGVGRGAQPLTAQQNADAPGSGGTFATTYAVVPQYLTSRNRGFFLENTEVSYFDMRPLHSVRVQVWSRSVDAQVLAGRTPAALIRAYTGYAGRMQPLPDWVGRGAIVGIQGGTATVREQVSKLQAAGMPLAGVWLQDWVGQRTTSFGRRLWWNWVLDSERYAGWDAMVADFRRQGIRVLTYANPMMVDAAGRPVDRNLLAEGREGGYLIDRPGGGTYLIDQGGFESGTVDLSSPAARRWMGGVLLDMARKYGASGWMADFAEQLPFDARLADADPAVWHNRFPAEWARLHAETLERAGLRDETVEFYRAAFTTSPRYARLFWSGDQNVDWSPEDGMPSALSSTLSGGLSGFALNHSDTGGYTTLADPPVRRSPELLLRWAEMNAFGGAMLRTHEGNRPDLNVQPYSTPELSRAFAKWAIVFRALAPYRRGVEREAARTGMPLVRPLWLGWPDDPRAERKVDQFTLGRDFLVAPAFAPGVTRTTAYLPAGRWTHLWTGRRYTSPARGRTATVPATLGFPAVFHRAGSEAARDLRTTLAREGLLAPPSR